ncbi:MAG: M14 family zinc carboxypeptidase, partial [Thermoanaerobaculia bacterium]
MQSALLFALSDMASHREHFLEQFWTLGKRSIAKAANEGPAAYVFTADQKRPGNLADLLSTLAQHGVEIHTLDLSFTTNKITYPKGSWVVRMDQPYSRLADALLDVQYVRAEDRVYDDAGHSGIRRTSSSRA